MSVTRPSESSSVRIVLPVYSKVPAWKSPKGKSEVMAEWMPGSSLTTPKIRSSTWTPRMAKRRPFSEWQKKSA
eukprot:5061547-Alexandrium_andersonii.AAC.1